jgi:mono/diheme cytochrome c family protein
LNRNTCAGGALLALLAVAGLLAGACVQSAPASQDPKRIDAPRLFEQACAKCHSPDGSGGLPTVANGPRPIDLRDPEWQRSRTDAEIAAAIHDGRGAMPPFSDVLTPVQIAEIVGHLRTLKAR